jgi:hypothetical protein
MSPDEIYARIAAINTHDDENAHATEDSIRDDVLKAIAAGDPTARALAEAALTTSNLEFARWFA